jgi:tetratricopeptide (TPR) repeat protein
LQIGDNEKAIEQFKYLQSFENVFPQNFKTAYTSTAIPARIALENKNWTAATKLELPPFDFPWDRFPWQKAILHFAKSMGYSQTGDIPSAEKELQTLKSLHQELVEMEDVYKANQTMIQIKIADAWINFANDNREAALALMVEAVKMEDNTSKHAVTPGEILPARELLGDMFLAMRKPSKALEAYEKDLQNHPNRFNGIYGAATAAKASDDLQKAKNYFEELISLTENTDSGRPEIAEAKAFIQKI